MVKKMSSGANIKRLDTSILRNEPNLAGRAKHGKWPKSAAFSTKHRDAWPETQPKSNPDVSSIEADQMGRWMIRRKFSIAWMDMIGRDFKKGPHGTKYGQNGSSRSLFYIQWIGTYFVLGAGPRRRLRSPRLVTLSRVR